ncbi:MAG: hypothetical protein SXQ77_06865, partial [Halobacteria archaeon]|nr:hypothetical protein [Halobacteria archaeon]
EAEDETRIDREVVWRVFAREYNDSDFSFKQGDDERAPNYVVTPTGAKVNRVFVVGVVTEVENIGDADDLYRARVSDPTGAFVVYAGQYQPDAMSFLAEVETPSFVAVVGKARTYKPDDSDEVYTSIRPEEINEVDAETRDRWNLETAERTLERIERVRRFFSDGETENARNIYDLGDTVEHYGVDADYLTELRETALDVVSELAGAGEDEDVEYGEMEVDTSGFDEAETEEEIGIEEEEDDDIGEIDDELGEIDDEETKSDEAEEDQALEDIDHEEVEGDEEAEGKWEWDEGQREEIKEEYGAEFSSASEIEPPEEDDGEEIEEEVGGDEDVEEEAEIGEDEEDEGETEAGEYEEEEIEEDIDEEVEEEAESESEEDELEGEGEEEAETDETDGESDTTEDPEDLVMSIIEDEDDGDGAERADIISQASEAGLSEDEAEDALEDLLLEGMCYPTDGDRIKPL